MCGIIGYLGKKNTTSVLLAGLERLSYRGYDSSGIAVISQGEINYWKKVGKLKNLKDHIQGLSITGEAGIGHTRWATHGIPNDINSHPHLSENRVAIVHNGIIENFEKLKKEALKKKAVLVSDTDSEIIACLLNQELSSGKYLTAAAITLLEKLEGSFAVAALVEGHDRKIVCLRKNMPIIIGVEPSEKFICSDIQTLLYYTRNFIELKDNEVAVVSPDKVKIYNNQHQEVDRPVQHVDWEITTEGKGDYPHYMLKEIYEQPNVVQNILNQYTFPSLSQQSESSFESKNHDELLNFFSTTQQNASLVDIQNAERFIIQACGTSWHAGLIAKYWIETYARVLVEVDISSELRYRNVLSRPHDIVLAISQSGETADTLACLREAKSHFMKVISFVNVRGSSIDRESDLSIYSLADREIGVASTKNYIAQLVNLYLFALYIGYKKNNLIADYVLSQISELKRFPQYIKSILRQSDRIKQLVEKFFGNKAFLFIGRGVNYPTALEGALKLKELAYVYAAGYAAGELKHGPLSLVDEKMPVFCVIPNSNIYPKTLNNLQEVRARKGKIIAIASEGNTEIQKHADYVFTIPDVHENLSPILAIVPLQLFSYYLADKLGCDVDQPKNLAKSVTVE